MLKTQILIGILTIISMVNSERTKRSGFKMTLLEEKRAPLMAMFDMTDINENIRAYVDEAIESSLSQQIEQKTKEAITAEIQSVVENWNTETRSRKVAFTAILSKSISLGDKQIIRYDNVITNVGNAYDPTTGILTVPASGVYSLSVSMMGHPDNGIHLQLVKNGNELVRLWTGGGGSYELASQTINVELAENDNVWVQRRESTGANIYGSEQYNVFSGALVFQ